jgi:DNA processing protein
LGSGVDVCYPQSNRKLYEELQVKGGVLSTYPPGTAPLARLFPARNRIVSGLADVLVVIEARCRSGTSITVEMALEQGKDIFAVPGRVTDRLSDGCNKMIKEGAHVLLSTEDFMLDLLELLPEKMTRLKAQNCENLKNPSKENGADSVENMADALKDDFVTYVLDVLDFYPRSLEDIIHQLKKKYQLEVQQEEFTAKIMYLCIVGLVKQDSPGWYSKKI